MTNTDFCVRSSAKYNDIPICMVDTVGDDPLDNCTSISDATTCTNSWACDGGTTTTGCHTNTGYQCNWDGASSCSIDSCGTKWDGTGAVDGGGYYILEPVEDGTGELGCEITKQLTESTIPLDVEPYKCSTDVNGNPENDCEGTTSTPRTFIGVYGYGVQDITTQTAWVNTYDTIYGQGTATTMQPTECDKYYYYKPKGGGDCPLTESCDIQYKCNDIPGFCQSRCQFYASALESNNENLEEPCSNITDMEICDNSWSCSGGTNYDGTCKLGVGSKCIWMDENGCTQSTPYVSSDGCMENIYCNETPVPTIEPTVATGSDEVEKSWFEKNKIYVISGVIGLFLCLIILVFLLK